MTTPEIPYTTRSLSRNYYFSTPIHTWVLDEPVESPNPDSRYAQLTQVEASEAQELPKAGKLVGHYVGPTPFSLDDLEWLLRNGCPNPNLHVQAEVRLMRTRKDTNGQWYLLVAIDDYWTFEHQREIYDFVVHVGKNGQIHLMNPHYYH